MSLQPLHRGDPQVRESLVDQAEAVLRAGVNGLKTEQFEAMVVKGEVPGAWVEAAVDEAMRDPSFAGITIEEFRAAVERVRPDLLPIMTSPSGERWLGKGLTKVGIKLALRVAGRVFGR